MALTPLNSSSINLQYLGFCNTSHLFNGDSVYGLRQLKIPKTPQTSFLNPSKLPERLGKRVEQFALHQLSQSQHINSIAQNIQIRQEKHTIGELDALLLVNNTPVHLEIVYKFYVYDPNEGSQELEHWIGPNRRDNLVKKLDKLKNKQLPLLHHPETIKYLKNYQLNSSDIKQQVLFKAQLFVPSRLEHCNIKQINEDCVVGKYYTENELTTFTNCQFFIPSKIEWLIENPQQSNWLEFIEFHKDLKILLLNKRSPLIWIKHPNGEIERCFVVWW